MRETDMEKYVQETQETGQATELAQEQTETREAGEQLEMNEGVKEQVSEEEAREQAEMDEGAIGYSSKYYMHEYERAVKNGNRIAQENALSNYARAKAREDLK